MVGPTISGRKILPHYVREGTLLKIGCLQTPQNLELILWDISITLIEMKGVRKGVRGDN